MSNSNKVLLIIFVILLGIVGIELIYFFVQPSLSKDKITKISTTTGQNKPSFTTEQSNLAVRQSQIEYLRTLRKADIDQLKMLYSFSGVGVVTNIKKLNETQISFDLIDENGKKSTNIRFPIIKDIPFNVYKTNNDVTTKASIKDVKEGNKIQFLLTYDLTKEHRSSNKEDYYHNKLTIYTNSNEKVY